MDLTGVDPAVGMAVTGLIPIVAIGSVVGLLVAVRDGQRERAIAFGLLFAISLAAMTWVYFFVFR